MNGTEAIEYIHSVCWMGSRPGLERITTLTELMGSPQSGLKVIHVAGTNGKGSFCAMMANILQAAGYKTGLFTSPYVVSFCERIRVNGENISDRDLGEVTEYVKSFVDTMEDSPTEFELLTAIAFEHFRRQACDVVVLEVGLGGRLDSTNIITSPLLSVITGIDLDHTAVLGDTHAKIAAEKSGIIKEGCPVVFGYGEAEAAEVVRRAAEAKNAKLYETDTGRLSFEYSSLAGSEFVFDGCRKYNLSLIGKYQISNAAVVLTAVDALREGGFSVPEGAVKHGLATVKWPARLELLSKSPLIIYDGAHNPQGVSTAVDIIKGFFGGGPVVILTGVMADKDHGIMTRRLAEAGSVIHTVTPDNPRAMDAAALAEELTCAGAHAVPHSTVSDGVAATLRSAEELGAPLVAIGSLYMYAEVAEAVRGCLGESAKDNGGAK